MKASWRQGEHIAVLGPTGCGKTRLNAALLDLRRYVAVVATKADDETLAEFYSGYRVIHDWKERRWSDARVLFWPEIKTLEQGKRIYPKIHTLLESVYVEKHWTLCLDDLKKCVYDGQVREDVRVLMTQARSQKISIVTNGQSPIGIKVSEVLDQASYWLMFHQNDEDRNCERMASVAGRAVKEIKALNAALSPHEFVFLSVHDDPVVVRKRA